MRTGATACFLLFRNGGGIEHAPWCYTMDPLVRWQHCHIEKCGEYPCRESCAAVHLHKTAIRQPCTGKKKNNTVIISVFKALTKRN
jgi:hypothetical protein